MFKIRKSASQKAGLRNVSTGETGAADFKSPRTSAQIKRKFQHLDGLYSDDAIKKAVYGIKKVRKPPVLTFSPQFDNMMQKLECRCHF